MFEIEVVVVVRNRLSLDAVLFLSQTTMRAFGRNLLVQYSTRTILDVQRDFLLLMRRVCAPQIDILNLGWRNLTTSNFETDDKGHQDSCNADCDSKPYNVSSGISIVSTLDAKDSNSRDCVSNRYDCQRVENLVVEIPRLLARFSSL